MSFNIGDRVYITDVGCVYSTYEQWLVDQDVPSPYFENFHYGKVPSEDEANNSFKIVVEGPHSVDNKTLIYLIESCEHNCYIFDEEGMTKAPPLILDWFD